MSLDKKTPLMNGKTIMRLKEVITTLSKLYVTVRARSWPCRSDEPTKPETAIADFDDIEQMLIEALRPLRKKYIAQLFGMFLLILGLTVLIHFFLNTVGLGARLYLSLGNRGHCWPLHTNGRDGGATQRMISEGERWKGQLNTTTEPTCRQSGI